MMTKRIKKSFIIECHQFDWRGIENAFIERHQQLPTTVSYIEYFIFHWAHKGRHFLFYVRMSRLIFRKSLFRYIKAFISSLSSSQGFSNKSQLAVILMNLCSQSNRFKNRNKTRQLVVAVQWTPKHCWLLLPEQPWSQLCLKVTLNKNVFFFVGEFVFHLPKIITGQTISANE